MPNASGTSTEKLSALIAEIEAEAYARGQADAKKEMLDLLGTGGERAARTRATRGRRAKTAAAPKRRASGRKRAPKGSVPRFVEQALREQPGLTPPEILARAANRHGAPDQTAVDPDRTAKRAEAGQVRVERRPLDPRGIGRGRGDRRGDTVSGRPAGFRHRPGRRRGPLPLELMTSPRGRGGFAGRRSRHTFSPPACGRGRGRAEAAIRSDRKMLEDFRGAPRAGRVGVSSAVRDCRPSARPHRSCHPGLVPRSRPSGNALDRAWKTRSPRPGSS